MTVVTRATTLLAALLAPLLLLFALAAPAFAVGEENAQPFGHRIALVIGNADYGAGIDSLKNAKSDAESVATALKNVGFQTTLLEDATRDQFTAALGQLSKDAKGADAVLLYYSGHGFQLSGSNYLVPVDAKLTSRDMIASQTIELNDILGQLASADRPTLILLDACRDNPLPQSVRGDDQSEGLAQITQMLNTYVAFSTQPGNVSVDGTGSNGPFAQALVQNIDAPGKSIGDVMISVRKAVLNETHQLQNPWEQANLTDQFYFNPEAASSTPLFGGLLSPQQVTVDNNVGGGTATVDTPTVIPTVPVAPPPSVPTAPPPTDVASVQPPAATTTDIGGGRVTPEAPSGVATTVVPTDGGTQPQGGDQDQPTMVLANVPTDNVQLANTPSIGTPNDVSSPAIQATEVELPEDIPSAIQGQLQRVGCYAGKIDGQWGNSSVDAVNAYYKQINETSTDTTASPGLYLKLKGEPDRAICSIVADAQAKPVVQPKPAQPKPAQPKPAAPTQPKQQPKQAVQQPKPAAPSQPPKQQGGGGLDANNIGNLGGVFR